MSGSDVVHLLETAGAVHVFQQLLERQFVERRVGGFRQLFVQQVNGRLAGRAVAGRLGFLEAEPAFGLMPLKRRHLDTAAARNPPK